MFAGYFPDMIFKNLLQHQLPISLQTITVIRHLKESNNFSQSSLIFSLFLLWCQWPILRSCHCFSFTFFFSSYPPLILLTLTLCCPSYRLWPTTLLLLLICHSAFLHSTIITPETPEGNKRLWSIRQPQGPHSWSLKCLKWQWRQSHLGGKIKQQQPRSSS